ncbi:MAG TPA: hypothetical protein DCR14_00180 [Acidimicrobiaceae bacterium]|nr:hypothetical protein [Acidimicrobiaceae bacterium]
MLTPITWEEYGKRDYLPVAVVDIAVEVAAAYHRLQFDDEVDDLGEVVWCPVRLGSGVAVLLNRYAGSPNEITVWGPDSLSPDQIAAEFGVGPDRVQRTIRP